MAFKKRRRSKTSKIGRTKSRNFFGNAKESFGKKKKNTTKFRDFSVWMACLIFVGGFVYWLVTRSIDENVGDKISVDVLFDENNFDPIGDFATIRDNGTIEQLDRLLNALTYRNLEFKMIPVRLDNYKKVIEIASIIIVHPERTESQRAVAARAKMDAYWKSYSLSTRHKLDDPFIVEQFFVAAEDLIDDPNKTVSRDAHLSKVKGLISETIQEKFLGGFDSVEDSIIKVIETFPEDPIVAENIRQLFTQIRSIDAENSITLAQKIASISENSDSPGMRELSRFMKDVIILYDSGIGNMKEIGSIMVDDEDFNQRLYDLNENMETGPTVITQLDNAIEFFERQRKYQHALELSKRVVENASKREHPESARLAKTLGENGVKRNSLVNNKWSFDLIDEYGQAINEERFKNKVVLVGFYLESGPETRSFLDNMSKLTQTFFGKTVEFVFVEVESDVERFDGFEPGSFDPGSIDSERWLTLRTTFDQPNEYYSQCPTQRFPFAILIDKTGIVDSVNVSLADVRRRIEYLLTLN